MIKAFNIKVNDALRYNKQTNLTVNRGKISLEK